MLERIKIPTEKITTAKKITPQKNSLLWVGLIFLLGFLVIPPSLAQSNRFEKLGVTLDPWSEGQIKFWNKVFSEYSSKDGLLHDSADLKIIYRIIPANMKLVEEEKSHIRHLLLSVAKKKAIVSDLTPEELRVFEAHDGNLDYRVFNFAAENDRIRFQLGQKDRLENAYGISTRYLKRMEEMFEEEGVPKELTRLPFVESGFLSSAKSSVGALGIWQFMPKTALKDLRVDSIIDERYDPLKSTRAAARFLRSNYKTLKSWSLAVMAYHHGPGMVLRASRKLKTEDPVKIVRIFKDSSFKFASRNYLFEFLAMLDIDASHKIFFKNIQSIPLPIFITVSFQKKMSLPDMIRQLKLAPEEIRLLNPHFLEPLWSGKSFIPAHYPVRLSGISLEDFRKTNML